MSKVILEFDYMPENCYECVLSTNNIYEGKQVWVCTAYYERVQVNINPNANERAKFCPLKEVHETLEQCEQRQNKLIAKFDVDLKNTITERN